jgi:hypothetical protein
MRERMSFLRLTIDATDSTRGRGVRGGARSKRGGEKDLTRAFTAALRVEKSSEVVSQRIGKRIEIKESGSVMQGSWSKRLPIISRAAILVPRSFPTGPFLRPAAPLVAICLVPVTSKSPKRRKQTRGIVGRERRILIEEGLRILL